MRSTVRWMAMLGVILVTPIVSSRDAQAIPSFAKKYSMTCSSCHTAWPLLNAFGRRFKENGYRINRDQEMSETDHVKADGMSLYKYSFVTARIKGYFFDKVKGGTTKIRPFHEAEIMLAGNVSDTVSAWVEVEAEDEGEWNVAAESGFVGYHPRDEFNLVAGYGPVFWADPYDTLADGGRRMTRAHKAIADLGFGTGQPLRKGTPQISSFGRIAKHLFYTAGVSTGIGDPEGEDKKDFHGRLAFDVKDNLTLGAFLLSGKRIFDVETDEDLSFSRYGIDLQAQFTNFEFLGAWMRATDDLDPTGLDEQNNVVYGQLFYFFRKDKRPVVVPFVRIEYYTNSDGSAKFTNGVFNLTAYPLENVNLSLEYWTNLDTPSGVSKSNRVTLLFNTVF